MAEHLETATFVQRTAASVVTGLGSVALLLAAIGLYGVIAGVGGATDCRRSACAWRSAPAAATSWGSMLGQGARIAVVGLAIGLGLALAVTRLLASLLVGVTPTDFVSYVLTVGVLAAVAIGAPHCRPAGRHGWTRSRRCDINR